jgi:hypothetical protein
MALVTGAEEEEDDDEEEVVVPVEPTEILEEADDLK